MYSNFLLFHLTFKYMRSFADFLIILS